MTLLMLYCSAGPFVVLKVHELVQKTFSKEVTCPGSGRLCTLESVGRRHSFSSLLEASARLGTGSSQGLSSNFITLCVCFMYLCVYIFHIRVHIHVKYTSTHVHMWACVWRPEDELWYCIIPQVLSSSPSFNLSSSSSFSSSPTLRAPLTGLKFTNQATSWPVGFSGPPVSASLGLRWQECTTMPSFLMWVLGIKLRASCLQGKSTFDWAPFSSSSSSSLSSSSASCGAGDEGPGFLVLCKPTAESQAQWFIILKSTLQRNIVSRSLLVGLRTCGLPRFPHFLQALLVTSAH